MITVVGMGRKADDLTLAGAEAIRAADVVVVKSALTHAAEAVGKIRQDAVYCDDLYQSAQNFDQLNEQIVRRLRSYKGKVAFCVVGDGRIAESGTHDELPAAGGRYKRIYEAQFAPTE